MKKIGVMANCRKAAAPAVLQRLAERAAELGLQIYTCDACGKMLPGARRVSAATMAGQIDVLLALGGDGTFLRAVRALNGRDKPVLGVNLGSLGFLTSVTEQNLDRALDALRRGKFRTSVRTMAECRVLRGRRQVAKYRALNDIVVGWGISSRVNTLALAVDGEPVAAYVCDGLIVSTPTGSTGHSLSAGGPILHPASPSFVISIICPHILTNRPLVVSDRSRITVSVVKAQKKLLLSVDGQEECAVQQGDRLEILRCARPARFVHLPGYSYFSVLRHKLGWRGSNA
ncbi:MAG: NAD(+)/NADH kinase [Verrucomicrobiota bacterium]